MASTLFVNTTFEILEGIVECGESPGTAVDGCPWAFDLYASTYFTTFPCTYVRRPMGESQRNVGLNRMPPRRANRVRKVFAPWIRILHCPRETRKDPGPLDLGKSKTGTNAPFRPATTGTQPTSIHSNGQRLALQTCSSNRHCLVSTGNQPSPVCGPRRIPTILAQLVRGRFGRRMLPAIREKTEDKNPELRR